MRQKLSLARAMIHHPKVLFLDEPTSGLDPESAQNVNKLIKEIAGKQGVTVFLCTHQLRYAQEICTRYGLISKGELLAAGTLDELRKRVDTGTELRIRTEKWLCTKINSEKEIRLLFEIWLMREKIFMRWKSDIRRWKIFILN